MNMYDSWWHLVFVWAAAALAERARAHTKPPSSPPVDPPHTLLPIKRTPTDVAEIMRMLGGVGP